MLNPRKLRILVAVATSGSIAGAASIAGCSAAAASQQLSALERQTGAQLLERSARSVRLTSAGELLVEHATRILADLEAAEQAVAAAGTLRGGRLRVASFGTAAARLCMPALAAFARRYPKVAVTFHEVEPEQSVPAVRAGEIDLAVTHQYARFPEPDLRGLAQAHLLTDPLLLAVPARLRPADASPVSLRAFADADWIATSPTEGFQAIAEMVGRAAGFEPKVTCRADDYSVILDLVAAGLGVALVPELAVAPRTGVTMLPIGHPPRLARTIHVTTRTADKSPAVAQLAQLLISRSRTLFATR
jgi:DNA-binding transcriptional LysR family regulator